MPEQHRCNRCGQLSYNGQWKDIRWFCSDCLRYTRLSPADTRGDTRSKTEAQRDATRKQIMKLVSRAPHITEYTKHIKRQGITNVSPDFKRGNHFFDGGVLRRYYYDLLKNKTLKDDVKLMDDIIKFRGRILKHRISCVVSLFSNNQKVAELRVYNVLIEDGQKIVDYWYDKNIDPSSFATYNNDFAYKMRASNQIRESNITQSPTKYSHIDWVKTEFYFS